jgi:hypothetical protein
MLGNRVRETANAPGTGTTVSLIGATTGYVGFVATFGTGASCYYAITDGSQTEIQVGTVTSGSPNTLSRGTPIWTSVHGTTSPSRLNFTGSVVVYSTLPAQRTVFQDNAGGVSLLGALAVSGAVSATGNATVGGTLGVTGLATLGSLVVNTTLSCSGAATVGGTLGVTGATTLSSLTVNGAVSAQALTVSSGALNAQFASTSGACGVEIGAPSGQVAYLDLKTPGTDDYDLRLITTGSGGEILGAKNAAKAWINGNGATMAIRDHYNVSSLVDMGTSIWDVNFTTPMANANYTVALATTQSGDGSWQVNIAASGITAPPTRMDANGIRLNGQDPNVFGAIFFGS